MKCELCNTEGYHELGCSRKYALEKVYCGPLEISFRAERYPGEPLLDTSVNLKVNNICITWSQKDNFTNDLNDLLKKYQI